MRPTVARPSRLDRPAGRSCSPRPNASVACPSPRCRRRCRRSARWQARCVRSRRTCLPPGSSPRSTGRRRGRAPARPGHARRHDFDIGFAARQQLAGDPACGAEARPIYGEIAREEFGTLTPEGSAEMGVPAPAAKDTFDFDRDGNDVDALVEFRRGQRHARARAPARPGTCLNPPWLYEVSRRADGGGAPRPTSTPSSRATPDAWTSGTWSTRDSTTRARGFGTEARPETPWKPTRSTPRSALTWLDIAFATARAADPDVALIYNDYGIGWLTDEVRARARARRRPARARACRSTASACRCTSSTPSRTFRGLLGSDAALRRS